MKHKILKIAYFVTAFVLAGAIILNGVTVPVLAAVEVESLPRSDIDVEVSYDSSNIYLNYEDNLYSITRRQQLYKTYPGKVRDYWIYGYDTDGELLYTYLKNFMDKAPQYTDLVNSTQSAPVSYWFSPSENRVYSFTGTVIDGVEYGKVKSMYSSSFIFGLYQGYCALNYWDLTDSSFHVLGLIAMYGGNDDYLSIYPVMYLNGTGGINTYRNESGGNSVFPNDMICIYSSYEISGFYEADVNSGTVYTPKYYFNYQYLFYVEDVGYTFIDSARSLVDIIDNSDTYAYLDFAEVCNRRVWTSPDGVSWAYVNLASAMYGDWQPIPYKWFFDNVGGNFVAKLVYTTDLDYGVEPIIKPEYKDLTDIIDSLKNSNLEYEVDKGTPDLGGPMDETDFWWDLANRLCADVGLSGNISGYFGVNEFSYNDFLQMYIFNSMTSLSMAMYNYETGEYISDRLTVLGALFGIYENTYDNNLLLDNLQLNLHNDLKSVFDNISLTNSYMESIDAALKDLPDYTKHFNESIGVQKDILEALEKLDSSPGTSTPGTSTPDINSNFDMVVFENWMSELDKSIDTIAKVEVFDEITDSDNIAEEVVGEVVEEVFDEVFDLENATSVKEDVNEFSTFVESSIAQICAGTMLINAFDYASNITSGVGYLNANINHFYTASSVLQPVFLSGAAMFVINLVLRRKE